MSNEASKLAWTKYNNSEKKKACAKRYCDAHKEELYLKSREWFKNNPDKVKEYNRKSSLKRVRSGKDKQTRDLLRKEKPEVLKAKDAANNAIRSGRLIRKYNCEICGEGGLIHKHHEDYSKPLEVCWLCPKCHKGVHKNG